MSMSTMEVKNVVTTNS